MVSVLTTARPRVAARKAPVVVEPSRSRRRLWPADLLWVGAWAAWAVALAQVNLGAARGSTGLLGALPITFFLAMLLLCASVCLHLQRPALSPVRLGAHVVSLVVMLQAPLPILYNGQARYYTQFKAVGETLYFSQHRGPDLSVDIYQRWPGFFTLFSWFDKVAGIQSPLSYLAWSEIGFDLLFALAFYFAAGALGLNPRQRWLATFLFLTGDWVATQGQDFYTPQALGFFLILIIVGLLLRAQQRSNLVSARHLVRAGPWRSSSRPDRLMTAVAVLLYVTVIFTHPLSPFVLVLYTVALTLVGRLRPVWLPLLFAGLALVYAAPNLSFLGHNGGLTGFGNILSNAAPAGVSAPIRLGPNHVLLPVLTAIVFGLGVLGIYRRWRVNEEWRSMAALLVSPIALLVVVHYGDETSYRILLFSMPWAVAGASSLFYNSEISTRTAGILRWSGAATVTAIVTVLSLATNYSQTELYQSSAPEVAGALYLNNVLSPGVVIYLDDEFPTSIGGDYPAYLAVDHGVYYQPELLNNKKFFSEPTQAAAGILAQSACGFTKPGDQPVYVVFSTGQERILADFDLISHAALQRLSTLLARSPSWKTSFANKDVTIYSPVDC